LIYSLQEHNSKWVYLHCCCENCHSRSHDRCGKAQMKCNFSVYQLGNNTMVK